MLNRVYEYVEYVKVLNMINENVSMFISQWYENGDYVKRCTHMYTQSY